MNSFLWIFLLLLSSFAVNAGVIEYGGYKRASDGNIVTGGGLEWLMWDQTKGKSINQALIEYGSNNWMLATGEQIAGLFNTFKFGHNNWGSTTVSQTHYSAWTDDENSAHNAFFRLFGYTQLMSCATTGPAEDCYYNHDPYMRANARYKVSNGSMTRYTAAVVLDDTENKFTRYLGAAGLAIGEYSANGRNGHVGVALVRTINISQTPVNTPGSLGLLLAGVFCFALYRLEVLKAVSNSNSLPSSRSASF
jgi:hypothetical protein